MVDESIKFAWAYLLIHGKLTNGKWSYYGSNWENLYTDFDNSVKQMEKLHNKIKKVGIDWRKTEIPEVDNQSSFNGTFSDDGDCLATLGKLVLMNGEKYLIGSADDDAAHLAETARNITQGRNCEVLELAKII